MVLLKLTGDRVALLGQDLMVWVADDARPLRDSLFELLRTLRHPKASLFLTEYRLTVNDGPLDLALTPPNAALSSGQEVVIQRVVAVETTPLGSTALEGNQGQILEDFLRNCGLRSMMPKLRSLGVSSLGLLCSRTSSEIGSSLGIDQRAAFGLISGAHNEIVRLKIHVDWKQRMTELYQRYNPARVQQVPALLQEFAGEEEYVWMALRRKYEAILFENVMRNQQNRESDRPRLKTVVQTTEVSPTRTDALEAHIDSSELLERKMFEAKLEAASQLESELRDVIAKLSQLNKVAEDDRAKHAQVVKEQEEWIKMLEFKLRQTQEQLAKVTREESQMATDDSRAKLRDFYSQYSPDRLQNVELLMNSYRGREREILFIIDATRPPFDLIPPPRALEIFEQNTPKIAPPRPTSINPPQTSDRVRRRLVDFYQKYAPDRLHLVESVMQQFQGRENELERLIEMQPIALAPAGLSQRTEVREGISSASSPATSLPKGIAPPPIVPSISSSIRWAAI